MFIPVSDTNAKSTAYIRLTKLRSAIANNDPDALAELLFQAEQAHAAWEAAGWAEGEWPEFYAKHLLGIQEHAAPDPCGEHGGFC